MTDIVENCFETQQGLKGNWPVSSVFAPADHRMSTPTVAMFSHRQAAGGVALNLLSLDASLSVQKEKKNAGSTHHTSVVHRGTASHHFRTINAKMAPCTHAMLEQRCVCTG